MLQRERHIEIRGGRKSVLPVVAAEVHELYVLTSRWQLKRGTELYERRNNQNRITPTLMTPSAWPLTHIATKTDVHIIARSVPTVNSDRRAHIHKTRRRQ